MDFESMVQRSAAGPADPGREVVVRRESMQALLDRLLQMDEELRGAIEKMNAFRELAYSDPLTGLRNRRYFDERLQEELSRSRRRRGGCFSLLVIDIDNFKNINDRLGHPAGDAVLKRVAQFLQDYLRGHDVRCRTGGDEFMVILPDADAAECAAAVARLRKWQSAVNIAGLPVVSLSMGWTTWPDGGSTAEELVAAADSAMYAEKQLRKNATQPASNEVGVEEGGFDLDIHVEAA